MDTTTTFIFNDGTSTGIPFDDVEKYILPISRTIKNYMDDMGEDSNVVLDCPHQLFTVAYFLMKTIKDGGSETYLQIENDKDKDGNDDENETPKTYDDDDEKVKAVLDLFANSGFDPTDGTGYIFEFFLFVNYLNCTKLNSIIAKLIANTMKALSPEDLAETFRKKGETDWSVFPFTPEIQIVADTLKITSSQSTGKGKDEIEETGKGKDEIAKLIDDTMKELSPEELAETLVITSTEETGKGKEEVE